MITEEHFKALELRYIAFKTALKIAGNRKRQEFLKMDFKALKEKDWFQYFKSLTDYYIDFALINDKEIKEKFISAGVNTRRLKWLIPIEKIEKKLDLITSKSRLQVLYHPLIFFLHWHLKIKIMYEMLLWQKMVLAYNDSKITMSKKMIVDLYRRRDEGGGELKTIKHVTDIPFSKKISNHEKEFGGRNIVKKELFQVLNGDTNKLCLRPMIDCFIDSGKTKTTEYCNIIYDFYLLIIKDDPGMFKNQGEFLAKAPKNYKTFKIYKKEKIYKTFMR